MTTEEKILNKALELFNKEGIEYIGMRELAASLDMRIGNITYYFPTKDQLVAHIAGQLAVANSTVIVVKEDITALSFMKIMQQVFINHQQYRCLMLSFVHLLTQNTELSKKYRSTEKNRRDTWRSNLLNLHKNGYLLTRSAADLDFLEANISLIARFWISEAVVSYRHLTTAQQINHYLGMVATIMQPYLSGKGKQEIKKFFKA